MAGYTRQSLAQILNGEIVSAPPLNAEFNQILSAFNNSTGHKHDGTTAEGPPIDRIADLDQNNLIFVDTSANQINFYIESSAASVGQISIQDGAIVPFTDNDIDLGSSSFEFKDLYIDGTANIDSLVADTVDINGGTIDNTVIGATTPAAATFTNLTVSTGSTINFSGATVSNGGTFTTVNISGGSITGITDLAIADGGTGASTASAARTNLGVAIGTNVQAYDAGLQSISGLTTTADQMIYTTSSDTYATASLTSAGRALLDDADASAQRTTLGLGTLATQNANSVAITGGAIAGVTINASVIGGTTPAAATFTTLNATGGGSLTGTWSDLGTVTTMDLNGGTIDGVTIGGASAAAATVTTLNATGGGALTGTWSDLGTVTTVDINGGTIDGVVIGGTTSAAGTFSTLNATGGGALTGTWTDLGTVTTVDINGGTVDGVVIGGASAGAGTFTTITATTSATTPLVTNAGTLALSATGANVIALSTNGSERARIDSSGNVGIGDAAPGSHYGSANRLLVRQDQDADTILGLTNATSGAAASTTLKMIGGTGNSFSVYRLVDGSGSPYMIESFGSAVGSRRWSFNGLERMRITSAGLMGLGTSSPGNLLTINGGVGTSSAGGVLGIRQKGDTFDDGITISSSFANSTRLWVDSGGTFSIRNTFTSNNSLALTKEGRVGVGTDAPDGRLHVHTASAGAVTANAVADDLVVENSGDGGITILTPAANTGYLLFGNPTDGETAGQVTFSGSGNLMGLGTSLSGGALAFYTNTFTERARIDSSGNFGIGTSSPSNFAGFTNLQVNGSTGGIIQATTGATTVLELITTAAEGRVGTRTNTPLVLKSNNIERMRLDISGNLGLGTTTMTGKFNVDSGASTTIIALNGTATNGSWSELLYNGSAFGYIGSGSNLVTGAATSDFVLRATTNMIFGISTSEKMRIDSSGNLLIGTTTAGASKLVVADDSIQINTAKTPASAAATGTTGEFAWDASYFYICTATNTWRRVAHATW
jgi:hypothetical protein